MRAVTVERFPGLNLWSDPGDSPGALDAMNVTIEPGRVRSRDGSSLLYTTTGQVTYAQEFTDQGTPDLILAAEGTPGNVYAIGVSGTLPGGGSTTLSSISAQGASGVAIGTPGDSFFYICSAAGSVVKRWDGAAWTAPAAAVLAAGNITVLSVSPTDNRLVAIASGLQRVNFSDPGAPETFGANNYVLLNPGDGEFIQAATVYNNQLYVFKQTKFYVFYGNSVDDTGEPVFNYRTVDTGVGVHGGTVWIPNAACAGADGVYFLANDGIYRTNGGPPQKISAAIEPFFAGDTHSFWQGGEWARTELRARLTYLDGRLYAALPTGSSTGVVLVYDSRQDAWSAWDLSARAITPFGRPAGDTRALVLGSGTTSVLRTDPALTADNAVAIVSRYRLPFEEYGAQAEKRLRETILEGSGSPVVRWSADWGALATGGTVALGTAPALADGRQSLAVVGRRLSLQVGAASGAWSLNRVQVNFADELRPAGIAA